MGRVIVGAKFLECEEVFLVAKLIVESKFVMSKYDANLDRTSVEVIALED